MVKRVAVAVGKRYSLRLRAQRNAPAPSSLQFDDMNDDCLEHMFNFLDINSLMKVCRVNTRHRSIVINHVIPLKTINFADVSSVRGVFALFGASMKRIIVHSDDMQKQMNENPAHSQFIEFLRLLVTFGKPGRLQQLNLTFGGNEYGIPIDILSVIGPFFENVHTLNFRLMNDHMRFFHQFMQAIPKHNLCTLSLHRVQVLGDWLVAETLPRLKKIHLCIRWDLYTSLENRLEIEAVNETRLIQFISNQSGSLVHVDYDCSTQGRIFVEMSQRMPNIEHLGTLMWWPGQPVNGSDNLALSQICRNKWKYLNAFKNLKCISLVSYVTDGSDLGEVFRILAAQNTVERMKLSLGWYGFSHESIAIAVNDLRRLYQLKTLDLNYYFNRNEFVFKLFENLPALTKCTIKSFKMTQAFISNMIRLARKLRVLVIYCKFDSFTPHFYKKLLKIRTMHREADGENDAENRLTIYFSEISIHGCINALGANYKPSIITLKNTDFYNNFC